MIAGLQEAASEGMRKPVCGVTWRTLDRRRCWKMIRYWLPQAGIDLMAFLTMLYKIR